MKNGTIDLSTYACWIELISRGVTRFFLYKKIMERFGFSGRDPYGARVAVGTRGRFPRRFLDWASVQIE